MCRVYERATDRVIRLESLMRPPFEVWAPQEIANLRAEADALQRTLDRYLGQSSSALGSSAHGSNGTVPQAMISTRIKTNSKVSQAGGRPAKHGPILEIIDQAGPVGLTIDEIDRASVAAGHPINRNSLRSFLWTQRGLGRLFSQDGRHIAAKFKNEREPEDETSGSPDLLEGAV